MPTYPRTFAHGLVFHVYCRVNRGQHIFDSPAEAASFASLLHEVVAGDGLVLLSWALLSNHYHLAARTTRVPLWKSMMRLQRRVSRQYNQRIGSKGRLWQTRYQARLVRSSEYLEHLLAYIALNPVAAGLVKDPAQWYWSGHRALVGLSTPVEIDRSAALLGLGEDPDEALRAYLDRVRHLAEVRGEHETVRTLPWWQSARSEYQTVAEAEIPDGASRFDGRLAVAKTPAPPLDLVLESCCASSGCSVEQLRGRSRGEAEVVARRALAKLAVGRLGYRSSEIAGMLRKSPCTVSRWLTSPSRGSAESTLTQEMIRRLADQGPPKMSDSAG